MKRAFEEISSTQQDEMQNANTEEHVVSEAPELILCESPEAQENSLPVIANVISTMPRPQVFRPYNPAIHPTSSPSIRMGPPYHFSQGMPFFPGPPAPPTRMVQPGPVAFRYRFFSAEPFSSQTPQQQFIPNIISIDDSSSASSLSSNHSSDGEDETDTGSVNQAEQENDEASQPPPLIVKSEVRMEPRATMRAGPSRADRLIITIPSDDSDASPPASPSTVKVRKAKISTFTAQPKSTNNPSPETTSILNLLGKADEDEDLTDLLQFGMTMVNQEQLMKTLSSIGDKDKPKRVNMKGLYSHVKHGNLAKVLAFLNAGANPAGNVKSEEGRTAIHIAASKGYLEVLMILLYKAGLSKIDCLDSKYRTALFLAIEKKHLNVAQFLVKAGASIQVKNGDSMNLLHVAARRGSLPLVKWLVQVGVPLNEQDKFGYSALMWAAEYDCNYEIIRFLIKKGANTNLIDNEMNICLHWSAIAGSFECTRELVSGATQPQVNATNKFGETPLHVAAKGDHYHVTQYLLLQGANHKVKNKHSATPLEVCPAGSKTFHCIRIRKEVGDAKKSPYTLIKDISRGKERIPVRCLNEVDNEPFPNDFVYINRPEASSQVSVHHGLSTVRPCKCETVCGPDCKCVKLSEKQKQWYTEDGRLDMSLFDEESPVLFECTPLCSCWSICSNRLVQKGIQFPLEVFKTRTKGWGLRTLVAVAQGSFILSYVGELITDEEAERRCADTYLFNLDLKTSGDEPNCMDALRYGNCGRFINHSCNANMKAVKLFTSHRDISFPEVAFFAYRDIESREELCFDYGDSFWDVKNESGMYCKCQAENCLYGRLR